MKTLKFRSVAALFLLWASAGFGEEASTESGTEYGPSESSYISGATFAEKEVEYSIINGNAVFEGDILLGTAEELRALKFKVQLRRLLETRPRDALLAADIESNLRFLHDALPDGVVIPGEEARWSNAEVHYVIDAGLSNSQRVEDAIAHWHAKTELKFIKRTDQADYIRFASSPEGCRSHVGKVGGEQAIWLSDACTKGNVIHEIGHAVGLWHEQSREDRNSHVEIDFNNVLADAAHNFNQHISDGDDVGAYDFGSIMHYPKNAFAKDPAKPTIRALSGNPGMGQRLTLSAGDVAAVKFMYYP